MFATLIPDPLHPAIVHFPMALAFLLPCFALGALVAIRRGAAPRTAWGLTVVLAAVLAGSALVAKETGEDQEERVEDIVPKAAFTAHEEAAERFVVVVLSVLAVSLVGLRRDRFGQAGRLVAAAGTLGVLAAGWSVGHAGGELVYRHGAASAYVRSAAGGVTVGGEPETEAGK